MRRIFLGRTRSASRSTRTKTARHTFQIDPLSLTQVSDPGASGRLLWSDRRQAGSDPLGRVVALLTLTRGLIPYPALGNRSRLVTSIRIVPMGRKLFSFARDLTVPKPYGHGRASPQPKTGDLWRVFEDQRVRLPFLGVVRRAERQYVRAGRHAGQIDINREEGGSAVRDDCRLQAPECLESVGKHLNLVSSLWRSEG